MAKTVAIANQKGGVGKTTTAVNLSACVAQLGKRVLAIDIDPQGNMTSGLGVDKDSVAASIYDLLINRTDAREAIIGTQIDGLDLIPANIELAGAEVELVSMMAREQVLKRALYAVQNDYDYVFIDCPPSLGLLTLNSLTAANTLMVPIQCEYYALEGLSQLMLTVRRVKKSYNPAITITGILITMYDGRLNLSAQVLDELKKYYSDKLFRTVIPRNVRLSEAPSYGEPALYHDKYSRGSLAYLDVAKELLARVL